MGTGNDDSSETTTMTYDSSSTASLKLALPKGRMNNNVIALLADAGISVTPTIRGYRPAVSLAGVDTKLMKPQNIVEMLAHGSRDIGFAGADWVRELELEAVLLIDTGLDPVRVVAASPAGLGASRTGRRLIVASEYERLAKCWIRQQNLNAEFLRSYGATEAFPPEDADIIIDNTATGSTLRSNGLEIIDVLMSSSTGFYASPMAMEDPAKREQIDDLCLLLRSVLEARQRVMIEVNVPEERLDAVVKLLPAMRKATTSHLLGEAAYRVKAAIPRSRLPEIVPKVKAAGGKDVVVVNISQIVP
jgi:ATP phosphoribosyltransferase